MRRAFADVCHAVHCASLTMNLVIQSCAPLSGECVSQLELLCERRAQRIDAHGVRFRDYGRGIDEALRRACDSAALDCALVPDRRFARFGLVAMDMDSTLITIECIDEIAACCGLKAEVAAITEAAMRGEIPDFNESLTRRVALLEGLDASALERVYEERLGLSPGAEALLGAARTHGVRTLLVSGGFTYFTERLQARLGIDRTRANTLEVVNGKLTGRVLGDIVNAEAKRDILLDTCADLGVAPENAIAIGDGSNDLQMMSVAGISVAFRAKPVVRAAATVAFNHVGLDGVLRLFPA
jgi:phosphoserine phosphatase